MLFRSGTAPLDFITGKLKDIFATSTVPGAEESDLNGYWEQDPETGEWTWKKTAAQGGAIRAASGGSIGCKSTRYRGGLAG